MAKKIKLNVPPDEVEALFTDGVNQNTAAQEELEVELAKDTQSAKKQKAAVDENTKQVKKVKDALKKKAEVDEKNATVMKDLSDMFKNMGADMEKAIEKAFATNNTLKNVVSTVGSKANFTDIMKEALNNAITKALGKVSKVNYNAMTAKDLGKAEKAIDNVLMDMFRQMQDAINGIIKLKNKNETISAVVKHLMPELQNLATNVQNRLSGRQGDAINDSADFNKFKEVMQEYEKAIKESIDTLNKIDKKNIAKNSNKIIALKEDAEKRINSIKDAVSKYDEAISKKGTLATPNEQLYIQNLYGVMEKYDKHLAYILNLFNKISEGMTTTSKKTGMRLFQHEGLNNASILDANVERLSSQAKNFIEMFENTDTEIEGYGKVKKDVDAAIKALNFLIDNLTKKTYKTKGTSDVTAAIATVNSRLDALEKAKNTNEYAKTFVEGANYTNTLLDRVFNSSYKNNADLVAEGKNPAAESPIVREKQNRLKVAIGSAINSVKGDVRDAALKTIEEEIKMNQLTVNSLNTKKHLTLNEHAALQKAKRNIFRLASQYNSFSNYDTKETTSFRDAADAVDRLTTPEINEFYKTINESRTPTLNASPAASDNYKKVIDIFNEVFSISNRKQRKEIIKAVKELLFKGSTKRDLGYIQELAAKLKANIRLTGNLNQVGTAEYGDITATDLMIPDKQTRKQDSIDVVGESLEKALVKGSLANLIKKSKDDAFLGMSKSEAQETAVNAIKDLQYRVKKNLPVDTNDLFKAGAYTKSEYNSVFANSDLAKSFISLAVGENPALNGLNSNAVLSLAKKMVVPSSENTSSLLKITGAYAKTTPYSDLGRYIDGIPAIVANTRENKGSYVKDYFSSELIDSITNKTGGITDVDAKHLLGNNMKAFVSNQLYKFFSTFNTNLDKNTETAIAQFINNFDSTQTLQPLDSNQKYLIKNFIKKGFTNLDTHESKWLETLVDEDANSEKIVPYATMIYGRNQIKNNLKDKNALLENVISNKNTSINDLMEQRDALAINARLTGTPDPKIKSIDDSITTLRQDIQPIIKEIEANEKTIESIDAELKDVKNLYNSVTLSKVGNAYTYITKDSYGNPVKNKYTLHELTTKLLPKKQRELADYMDMQNNAIPAAMQTQSELDASLPKYEANLRSKVKSAMHIARNKSVTDTDITAALSEYNYFSDTRDKINKRIRTYEDMMTYDSTLNKKLRSNISDPMQYMATLRKIQNLKIKATEQLDAAYERHDDLQKVVDAYNELNQHKQKQKDVRNSIYKMTDDIKNNIPILTKQVEELQVYTRNYNMLLAKQSMYKDNIVENVAVKLVDSVANTSNTKGAYSNLIAANSDLFAKYTNKYYKPEKALLYTAADTNSVLSNDDLETITFNTILNSISKNKSYSSDLVTRVMDYMKNNAPADAAQKNSYLKGLLQDFTSNKLQKYMTAVSMEDFGNRGSAMLDFGVTEKGNYLTPELLKKLDMKIALGNLLYKKNDDGTDNKSYNATEADKYKTYLTNAVNDISNKGISLKYVDDYMAKNAKFSKVGSEGYKFVNELLKALSAEKIGANQQALMNTNADVQTGLTYVEDLVKDFNFAKFKNISRPNLFDHLQSGNINANTVNAAVDKIRTEFLDAVFNSVVDKNFITNAVSSIRKNIGGKKTGSIVSDAAIEAAVTNKLNAIKSSATTSSGLLSDLNNFNVNTSAFSNAISLNADLKKKTAVEKILTNIGNIQAVYTAAGDDVAKKINYNKLNNKVDDYNTLLGSPIKTKMSITDIETAIADFNAAADKVKQTSENFTGKDSNVVAKSYAHLLDKKENLLNLLAKAETAEQDAINKRLTDLNNVAATIESIVKENQGKDIASEKKTKLQANFQSAILAAKNKVATIADATIRSDLADAITKLEQQGLTANIPSMSMPTLATASIDTPIKNSMDKLKSTIDDAILNQIQQNIDSGILWSEKVLYKFGNVSAISGKSGELEAHHIIPKYMGGSATDINNGVALLKEEHDQLHRLLTTLETAIKDGRMKDANLKIFELMSQFGKYSPAGMDKTGKSFLLGLSDAEIARYLLENGSHSPEMKGILSSIIGKSTIPQSGYGKKRIEDAVSFYSSNDDFYSQNTLMNRLYNKKEFAGVADPRVFGSTASTQNLTVDKAGNKYYNTVQSYRDSIAKLEAELQNNASLNPDQVKGIYDQIAQYEGVINVLQKKLDSGARTITRKLKDNGKFAHTDYTLDKSFQDADTAIKNSLLDSGTIFNRLGNNKFDKLQQAIFKSTAGSGLGYDSKGKATSWNLFDTDLNTSTMARNLYKNLLSRSQAYSEFMQDNRLNLTDSVGNPLANPYTQAAQQVKSMLYNSDGRLKNADEIKKVLTSDDFRKLFLDKLNKDIEAFDETLIKGMKESMSEVQAKAKLSTVDAHASSLMKGYEGADGRLYRGNGIGNSIIIGNKGDKENNVEYYAGSESEWLRDKYIRNVIPAPKNETNPSDTFLGSINAAKTYEGALNNLIQRITQVKNDIPDFIQTFNLSFTKAAFAFSRVAYGIRTISMELMALKGMAAYTFKTLVGYAQTYGEQVLKDTELQKRASIVLTGIFDKDKSAQMMSFAQKYAVTSPAKLEDIIYAVQASGLNPQTRKMLDATKGKDELDNKLKELVNLQIGLGMLKPEQGVKGAAYALREGMAGQFMSIRRRFEINPLSIASAGNMTVDEIKNDPEKFQQAMKSYLDLTVSENSLKNLSRLYTVQVENIKDFVVRANTIIGESGFYEKAVNTATRIAESFSLILNTDHFKNQLKGISNELSLFVDNYYNKIVNTIINIGKPLNKKELAELKDTDKEQYAKAKNYADMYDKTKKALEDEFKKAESNGELSKGASMESYVNQGLATANVITGIKLALHGLNILVEKVGDYFSKMFSGWFTDAESAEQKMEIFAKRIWEITETIINAVKGLFTGYITILNTINSSSMPEWMKTLSIFFATFPIATANIVINTLRVFFETIPAFLNTEMYSKFKDLAKHSMLTVGTGINTLAKSVSVSGVKEAYTDLLKTKELKDEFLQQKKEKIIELVATSKYKDASKADKLAMVQDVVKSVNEGLNEAAKDRAGGMKKGVAALFTSLSFLVRTGSLLYMSGIFASGFLSAEGGILDGLINGVKSIFGKLFIWIDNWIPDAFRDFLGSDFLFGIVQQGGILLALFPMESFALITAGFNGITAAISAMSVALMNPFILTSLTAMIGAAKAAKYVIDLTQRESAIGKTVKEYENTKEYFDGKSWLSTHKSDADTLTNYIPASQYVKNVVNESDAKDILPLATSDLIVNALKDKFIKDPAYNKMYKNNIQNLKIGETFAGYTKMKDADTGKEVITFSPDAFVRNATFRKEIYDIVDAYKSSKVEDLQSDLSFAADLSNPQNDVTKYFAEKVTSWTAASTSDKIKIIQKTPALLKAAQEKNAKAEELFKNIDSPETVKLVNEILPDANVNAAKLKQVISSMSLGLYDFSKTIANATENQKNNLEKNKKVFAEGKDSTNDLVLSLRKKQQEIFSNSITSEAAKFDTAQTNDTEEKVNTIRQLASGIIKQGIQLGSLEFSKQRALNANNIASMPISIYKSISAASSYMDVLPKMAKEYEKIVKVKETADEKMRLIAESYGTNNDILADKIQQIKTQYDRRRQSYVADGFGEEQVAMLNEQSIKTEAAVVEQAYRQSLQNIFTYFKNFKDDVKGLNLNGMFLNIFEIEQKNKLDLMIKNLLTLKEAGKISEQDYAKFTSAARIGNAMDTLKNNPEFANIASFTNTKDNRVVHAKEEYKTLSTFIDEKLKEILSNESNFTSDSVSMSSKMTTEAKALYDAYIRYRKDALAGLTQAEQAENTKQEELERKHADFVYKVKKEMLEVTNQDLAAKLFAIEYEKQQRVKTLTEELKDFKDKEQLLAQVTILEEKKKTKQIEQEYKSTLQNIYNYFKSFKDDIKGLNMKGLFTDIFEVEQKEKLEKTLNDLATLLAKGVITAENYKKMVTAAKTANMVDSIKNNPDFSNVISFSNDKDTRLSEAKKELPDFLAYIKAKEDAIKNSSDSYKSATYSVVNLTNIMYAKLYDGLIGLLENIKSVLPFGIAGFLGIDGVIAKLHSFKAALNLNTGKSNELTDDAKLSLETLASLRKKAESGIAHAGESGANKQKELEKKHLELIHKIKQETLEATGHELAAKIESIEFERQQRLKSLDEELKDFKDKEQLKTQITLLEEMKKQKQIKEMKLELDKDMLDNTFLSPELRMSAYTRIADDELAKKINKIKDAKAIAGFSDAEMSALIAAVQQDAKMAKLKKEYEILKSQPTMKELLGGEEAFKIFDSFNDKLVENLDTIVKFKYTTTSTLKAISDSYKYTTLSAKEYGDLQKKNANLTPNLTTDKSYVASLKNAKNSTKGYVPSSKVKGSATGSYMSEDMTGLLFGLQEFTYKESTKALIDQIVEESKLSDIQLSRASKFHGYTVEQIKQTRDMIAQLRVLYQVEESYWKMREERAKMANDKSEAVVLGIREAVNALPKDFDLIKAATNSTFTSMKDGISNILVAGFNRDTEGMKNAWNSMLDAIRQAFFKMIADMVASRIMKSVFPVEQPAELENQKKGALKTVTDMLTNSTANITSATVDLTTSILPVTTQFQTLGSASVNLVNAFNVAAANLGGSATSGSGISSLFNNENTDSNSYMDYDENGELVEYTPYANGGIISQPTLSLMGEGRYKEAVVPLPDGRAIPVSMTGKQESSKEQQQQPLQIINVLDESAINALIAKNPNTVINVINADILQKGQTYRSIKKG